MWGKKKNTYKLWNSTEEIEKALSDSYFSALKSSCRMVSMNKKMSREEKNTYMKETCQVFQLGKYYKTIR